MKKLGETLKIVKEIKDNTEKISITISKLFEAKELYWLQHYNIEEFDKAVVDLKTGQAILTVSTEFHSAGEGLYGNR